MLVKMPLFFVVVVIVVVAIADGKKIRDCVKCLNICAKEKCQKCPFPPLGLKEDRMLTPFRDTVQDRDYTFNYVATINDASLDPSVGIQPLSTILNFESEDYLTFRYSGFIKALNGESPLHHIDEWQRLHDYCRSSCANQTFGYLAWASSDLDPVRWNGQCLTGNRQSPIDIPANCGEDDVSNGTLEYFGFETSYNNYGIVNDGTSVKFYLPPEITETMGVILDGVRYNTTSWLYHWPSEHSIGGRRALIEKHFVHEAEDGKQLIQVFLSVLDTLNDSSRVYPNFKPIMDSIHEADLYEPGQDMDFTKTRPAIQRSILLYNSSYYRYEGSVTTPPCEEKVTYLVSSDISYISEESWKILKNVKRCELTEIYHNDSRVISVTNHMWGNARSTQPINGREIKIVRYTV